MPKVLMTCDIVQTRTDTENRGRKLQYPEHSVVVEVGDDRYYVKARTEEELVTMEQYVGQTVNLPVKVTPYVSAKGVPGLNFALAAPPKKKGEAA